MEKFILTNEIQEPPALTWVYGNKEYQIASRGMVLYIAGQKGSYKSTLARGLLAAAVNSDGYINYRYKRNGKKLVWVDTESPPDLMNRHVRDFMKMAGLESIPDYIEIYRLNTISDPKERRANLVAYIEKNKDDIDLLIVDVFADLADDESSISESNELIGSIASLVDNYNVLAIITSHTNNDNTLLNHLGKKIDRKSRTGYILIKSMGAVIVIPGKDSYERLPVSEFMVDNDRLLIEGEYIPFPIFQKQKIF